MAENGLVLGGGFTDSRNQLLRDDQEVNWGLRLDVVNDDAVLIFVFDLGGDFSIDDLLEKRLGHAGNVWLRIAPIAREFTKRAGSDWPAEKCGRRRARGCS